MEKPGTPWTDQGQVLGHLMMKRVCSHGRRPSSFPRLGLDQQGAAQGALEPLLSPICTGGRGDPGSRPLSPRLTGIRGRAGGGELNKRRPPAPIQLPPRAPEASLQASCLPPAHLFLPAFPFLGGRNLAFLFTATSSWMRDPSWTEQGPCGCMQVQ